MKEEINVMKEETNAMKEQINAMKEEKFDPYAVEKGEVYKTGIGKSVLTIARAEEDSDYSKAGMRVNCSVLCVGPTVEFKKESGWIKYRLDTGYIEKVKRGTVEYEWFEACERLKCAVSLDTHRFIRLRAGMEDEYAMQRHLTDAGVIPHSTFVLKSDDVDHPIHYNATSTEVLVMMEAVWGKEAVRQFCEMHAFKYRMRAGYKGEAATDIEKALWYERRAKCL